MLQLRRLGQLQRSCARMFVAGSRVALRRVRRSLRCQNSSQSHGRQLESGRFHNGPLVREKGSVVPKTAESPAHALELPNGLRCFGPRGPHQYRERGTRSCCTISGALPLQARRALGKKPRRRPLGTRSLIRAANQIIPRRE